MPLYKISVQCSINLPSQYIQQNLGALVLKVSWGVGGVLLIKKLKD